MRQPPPQHRGPGMGTGAGAEAEAEAGAGAGVGVRAGSQAGGGLNRRPWSCDPAPAEGLR